MLWLLLLVIIIVAIIVKIKRNTRTFYIKSGFEEPTQSPRSDELYQQSVSATSEKMIRCPTCGIYIPISEAIHKDGQYYCCHEHVQK